MNTFRHCAWSIKFLSASTITLVPKPHTLRKRSFRKFRPQGQAPVDGLGALKQELQAEHVHIICDPHIEFSVSGLNGTFRTSCIFLE